MIRQIDVSSRRDRVSPIQYIDRLSRQSSRRSSIRTLEVGDEIEIHDQKKGIAPPQDEPFSFTFFDKSPAVSGARKAYLTELTKGVTVVSVVIFCLFSIYWGTLWILPTGSVDGWIVDFDGGSIGAFVTQRVMTAPISFIRWHVVPAANFPGGIPQVEDAVVEQKAWVALTIAPEITSQLNASIDSPNALYNASQAIKLFGNEGRNENLYRTLLRPAYTNFLASMTSEFAVQSAKGHAANQNLASILAISPQTIVEPVGFVVTTVRAFDISVASADMFIGLVYLTVISFAIVSMAYNLRERTGLNRLLKFRSLVLLRLTSSCIIYFVLSLCYTLVNRAFQVNFNRKFGKAGFFIFWMLHWAGMMALGGALEALMPLLTPRFIAYFLLLWIICDVSVVQWPIPLLPSIYRYGYGSCFYNLSIAIRTILFSIKNEIGLNFGILIVWMAISCGTLTLIQYYVRRRDIRALQGPPVEVPQNDFEKIEHVVSFTDMQPGVL